MWLAMLLTSVGAIIQCSSFHVCFWYPCKFQLIKLTSYGMVDCAADDWTCHYWDGFVIDLGGEFLT